MTGFDTAWKKYKEVMDNNTADTSEKLSKIKKQRVKKRAVAFKEFWNLDLTDRKKQYEVIKKYYKEKEIGKSLKQHLYFKTDKVDNLPKTIKAAINAKNQKLLDEEIKFERKVLELGFFGKFKMGPIEDVIKKWRKKNKPTRKEQFDKFWMKNVDGPLTKKYGKKKAKNLKF